MVVLTVVPPVWRLLASVAVLAGLAVIAGGSAQGAGAPKLRMVGASPVRLAGSGPPTRPRRPGPYCAAAACQLSMSAR